MHIKLFLGLAYMQVDRWLGHEISELKKDLDVWFFPHYLNEVFQTLQDLASTELHLYIPGLMTDLQHTYVHTDLM